MKKLAKALALLLAAVMLLSLCACGGSKTETPAPGKTDTGASSEPAKTDPGTTAPGKTALYTSTDSSFASLLVLNAENAQIECGEFYETIHKGESWFIPAGSGEVKISGRAEVIVTEVN